MIQSNNGSGININDNIRYQDSNDLNNIDYLGIIKEYHGDYLSVYITKSFNTINKHLENTIVKLPNYDFYYHNNIWIVKV